MPAEPPARRCGYARPGVRDITTDRAGYGRSTRHRGRSVADEAADVREVADALGLHRFSVAGGSGGGPQALACGALLAGRVERVACQSGLAPIGAGGMSREAWLDGMSDEIAQEAGLGGGRRGGARSRADGRPAADGGAPGDRPGLPLRRGHERRRPRGARPARGGGGVHPHRRGAGGARRGRLGGRQPGVHPAVGIRPRRRHRAGAAHLRAGGRLLPARPRAMDGPSPSGRRWSSRTRPVATSPRISRRTSPARSPGSGPASCQPPRVSAGRNPRRGGLAQTDISANRPPRSRRSAKFRLWMGSSAIGHVEDEAFRRLR